MTIAEKLEKVIENTPKVYEAGQKSMVDESKIIEVTATGKGSITLNDVSEIPHKITAFLGMVLNTNLALDYPEDIGDETISSIGKTQIAGIDYPSPENRGKGYIDIITKDNLVMFFTVEQEDFPYERVKVGDTIIFDSCTNGIASVRIFTTVTTERYYGGNVHWLDGMPYSSNILMPIKEFDEDGRTISCEYYYYVEDIIEEPNKRFSTCTIEVGDDFDFAVLEGSSGIMLDIYDIDDSFLVAYPTFEHLTLTVTDNDTNTETYTPNANGFIEGITSYSPNMVFTVNGGNVKFTVEYHKSWGMQTERDKLWEVFQNNGKGANYRYAFCYSRFNDNTYNPVCDIVCTNSDSAGQYMFYQSPITDTKVGIYAPNTNLAYAFRDADIKIIRLLNVYEATSYSNTFYGCTGLVEIRFSGTIGQTISFSACSKLSSESVDSIINAAANGITITFHSNVVGRMTDEQWSLVDSKSLIIK
jgi:hypothetical protein